ncbi:MAG: DUF1998 domain-containing protein [Bacteroidales bacterium]|jgi:hypothetical protein|nr:DUF1998 domain-containing protein [Bacteroidales bacterium]
MAEKINHGRSKMISSYGGVGSVIDTPDASIIIETFDKWGYPDLYEKDDNGHYKLKKHIILDDRLVNRLRVRFPKLKHLVSIPVEEDGWKTDVQPQANYFPKWFYCPRCKRFMPLKQWKDHWKGRQEFDLQCFNPDCKGEHLEQVRFVMTCADGHIQDLPWEFWNNRMPISENESEVGNGSDNEQEEKSTIRLIYKKCCDEQELYYKISNENTDLSGIHIECKKCGKSATLKGIFGFSQKCGGRKYWLGLQNGQYVGDTCEQKVVVKIKTSNSIYYSNTLSSLWIPEKQIIQLTTEVRTEIDAIVNDPEYVENDLNKFARRSNIDIEIIKQYLDGADISYIPDIVYRKAEYEYFTQKEQPEDKVIKFRQINVKDTLYGFEKLVKIDRLKKITVQTSFTRNEPIDTDSILIGDSGYEYNVKRQSVSKNSFETHLLPAIENYGEGILFVLDEQKLKEWEKNDIITERIKNIQTHAEDSDWQSHKIEAKKITARKILIHTLSHLLIREFEYVCGYPMSSLQERLYVSESMNGFLISAYDGTDGYLGGLTKLCNNLDKLQSIITSALQRAKDCSLDPICYENEGQGIAQLNLAACHSCTLIPDTSCEMSNLFLDRRFVIDGNFGYFKDI